MTLLEAADSEHPVLIRSDLARHVILAVHSLPYPKRVASSQWIFNEEDVFLAVVRWGHIDVAEEGSVAELPLNEDPGIVHRDRMTELRIAATCTFQPFQGSTGCIACGEYVHASTGGRNE